MQPANQTNTHTHTPSRIGLYLFFQSHLWASHNPRYYKQALIEQPGAPSLPTCLPDWAVGLITDRIKRLCGIQIKMKERKIRWVQLPDREKRQKRRIEEQERRREKGGCALNFNLRDKDTKLLSVSLTDSWISCCSHWHKDAIYSMSICSATCGLFAHFWT